MKQTIYIVEDDSAVRRSLQLLFETLGKSAATFASAEEFLAAEDDDFDGCLLLDLNLPGMNGLALQKQLTARGVTLPVIVVTGNGEDSARLQALDQGAVAYLEKPYTATELMDTVLKQLCHDS